MDSATMMDKELELIEAHFIFGIPYARIDVLVHPPSLVHSLVEFHDGATMAQLGIPTCAPHRPGPERLAAVCPGVSFPPTSPHHTSAGVRASTLGDSPHGLARRAGERGGAAHYVLDAANEAAVAAFLEGAPLDEVVPLVERSLERANLPGGPDLDSLVAPSTPGPARMSGRLR